MCCLSANHTALRKKSKYWLAWNQDTAFLRVFGFQIGGAISVS